MSKIEWTDKTWNPVTGCTKVSQGCKNCYAERMYERFNGKGSFKNIICHNDRLTHPLKWKKPAMVFVNSMSDLFHEDVPFKFIYLVFSVMDGTPQHTYQVLTKRPERMLQYVEWVKKELGWFPKYKNVWIGVSVEDQATADERIPLLMQMPAAVRFLSCEPLLGPIDLHRSVICLKSRSVGMTGAPNPFLKKINWVIVGGESGPGARPMLPDWVHGLKDQCNKAGMSFFFKQWGEYLPVIDYMEIGDYKSKSSILKHGFYFERVGKKKAGRLLDGVEYSEMPLCR